MVNKEVNIEQQCLLWRNREGPKETLQRTTVNHNCIKQQLSMTSLALKSDFLSVVVRSCECHPCGHMHCQRIEIVNCKQTSPERPSNATSKTCKWGATGTRLNDPPPLEACSHCKPHHAVLSNFRLRVVWSEAARQLMKRSKRQINIKEILSRFFIEFKYIFLHSPVSIYLNIWFSC